MNPEGIREIRKVHGETEINAMLATGKWRMLALDFEDESVVAFMVRVRA
jgi:hypothetical protein